MKRANISYVKNNLSKLLAEVRSGESILIVDRDVPVARLEPITNLESTAPRLAGLAREGILSLPKHSPDVTSFLGRDKVKLKGQASAVQTLIEERGEEP